MKKQFMILVALVVLALLATTSLALADGPSPPAGDPSVVDVALAINAETGEFSTLIAAVVCTNGSPAR